MDKEVSSTIHLATVLLAISAVLLIVIYTVMVGNELRIDLINSGVQTQVQLESSQLQSLNGKDEGIYPRAAIYTIIAKEKNVVGTLKINNITYVTNNRGFWVNEDYRDYEYNAAIPETKTYIFPEDIILLNMNGKIITKVEKNSMDSYDITLTDLD